MYPTPKIVMFGRRMCDACAKLKQNLINEGYSFDYFCLDPPNCGFDKDDPHAVAEWERSRLALVAASVFGLLASGDVRVPILLRVHADPCDTLTHKEAFEKIAVLKDDGTVTLDNLVRS